MQNSSPLAGIKHLESGLNNLFARIDIDTLEKAEKKAVMSIKRTMIDARLDIRDYELSETRAEQLECAVVAKKRLKKLQDDILASGNVFGAADVAQLGAELEQINTQLD